MSAAWLTHPGLLADRLASEHFTMVDETEEESTDVREVDYYYIRWVMKLTAEAVLEELGLLGLFYPNEDLCGASDDDGFFCTRLPDHDGVHSAGSVAGIVARRWEAGETTDG